MSLVARVRQIFSRGRGTALVAVLAAVSMGGDLFLPDDGFVTRFMDDAAYYFTIARHTAAGHGMTFDGLHGTNGMQPLWFGLLVPIFRWVPGDVEALRVVAALEVVLLAAAAALLFRTLQAKTGTAAAVCAVAVMAAAPRADEILRHGMESALMLLLLLVAWRRTARALCAASTLDWLRTGCLWALAFLTRLELILAPLIVATCHWPTLRTQKRHLAALVGPSAVVALLYVTVNHYAFGSYLPVSGLVKSHWGAGRSLDDHLRGWFTFPWVLHEAVVRGFGCGPLVTSCAPVVKGTYAVGLVVLVLLVGWKRRVVLAAIRQAGAGTLLAICAVLMGIDVLVVVRMAAWKEAPIVLATAVLVAVGASRLPRGRRALAGALCVAGLLRPATLVADIGETQPGNSAARVQAGRWLRTHLPPGEKVGSWNAGMLGYFSHQPVVNLDGLVNDLGFYRRVVKAGDLEGYLRDENINWLCDQGCGHDPRPRTFLASGRAAHLDPQFQIVHVFTVPYGAGCRGYTLWHRRSP